MVGHVDSISSLDSDPLTPSFVSGGKLYWANFYCLVGKSLCVNVGHDCSVRWWDLRTYNCIQEVSPHRRKGAEGICAVRYHPSGRWLASSGADSSIKLLI